VRKSRKIALPSSLKHQLLAYNLFLFLAILIMISFLHLNSLNTHKVYTNFTTEFRDLSEFYNNVKNASIAAENHLYTNTSENLNIYEENLIRAKNSIEVLSTKIQSENLEWRLSLLENMIETYDDIFRKLSENLYASKEEYSKDYDFLVSTSRNIANTSTEYYNLITNEINVINLEVSEKHKKQLITTLVFSVIILLSGISFVAIYIYNITNPISTIVKNINKIKAGQYNLKRVKHSAKEITILCEAFEDMAHTIKIQIESERYRAELELKLLEKENENLKMSENLMESELKALQAQVNPHFLFNTLSMISKMAYIENAFQTSDMMNTVAELLRYSLEKSSKTSDLFAEIECVRNYYIIQEKRFGHRVKFSINTSHHMCNVNMPGMILQPLVENAIKHGVGQMVKDALINVSVLQYREDLFIVIEDNGAGMAVETVQAIFENSIPESSKGTTIGFHNVLRRLEMFYGDDFKAYIESDLGMGTLIILRLPII